MRRGTPRTQQHEGAAWTWRALRRVQRGGRASFALGGADARLLPGCVLQRRAGWRAAAQRRAQLRGV
jgi:hypothetical protein